MKLKAPKPDCDCNKCRLCRNRERRRALRERYAKMQAATAKTDAELDREALNWLRQGALR